MKTIYKCCSLTHYSSSMIPRLTGSTPWYGFFLMFRRSFLPNPLQRESVYLKFKWTRKTVVTSVLGFIVVPGVLYWATVKSNVSPFASRSNLPLTHSSRNDGTGMESVKGSLSLFAHKLLLWLDIHRTRYIRIIHSRVFISANGVHRKAEQEYIFLPITQPASIDCMGFVIHAYTIQSPLCTLPRRLH